MLELSTPCCLAVHAVPLHFPKLDAHVSAGARMQHRPPLPRAPQQSDTSPHSMPPGPHLAERA